MKIMAVDDDVISLRLLQECLAEGGYDFTTLMSSPTNVVKTLSDTAIPYDCILLDIEMPVMNGITLCGEIRKLPRYRNAPILMITKRTDHVSIRKAFSNGATDYITKPFEFLEVLTRIRVAERLVQERRAALDSYSAFDSDQPAHPASPAARMPAQFPGILSQDNVIVSDRFLPLSTFQNYLEQMVRDPDSEIELTAIKIGQIDVIFANTTAAQFISFLDNVAETTAAEFGEEGFITHIGKGVLLCARQKGEAHDPATMESNLAKGINHQLLLSEFFAHKPPEMIVGAPLPLTTTAKLNFNRAVKAATARMLKRERDLNELSRPEAFV